MTEAAVIEPGKIDLGRVIAETFRVTGRNITTFSALGLLLCGLPLAIVGYFQALWAGDQLDGLSSGARVFSTGPVLGVIYGGLATLVAMAILQGALIYATVQELNGRKPGIGESLAMGLRNFLPLIGLGLLLGVAVVFGFVLLVVPGIMMLCAWCVAAASLVADRTGVIGAFGRSAELTRGNRWSIFGLLVIVWVISMVLDAIVNTALRVSAFGSDDPLEMVARTLSPLGIVLGVVRTTVAAVITSAAIAVLYVELRRAQEGLGPQWLREIFS